MFKKPKHFNRFTISSIYNLYIYIDLSLGYYTLKLYNSNYFIEIYLQYIDYTARICFKLPYSNYFVLNLLYIIAIFL